MSSYTIKSDTRNYVVTESNGVCIKASPEIDWTLNLSFRHLRDFCNRKGWLIIPQLEDTNENTFVFKGVRYVVTLNDNQISRMTADDEEITWQDLPDALKGLL